MNLAVAPHGQRVLASPNQPLNIRHRSRARRQESCPQYPLCRLQAILGSAVIIMLMAVRIFDWLPRCRLGINYCTPRDLNVCDSTTLVQINKLYYWIPFAVISVL
jgi:hypothetical protein